MKGVYSYKIKFSEIKLEKEEISSFMGLGSIPDEPFGSMIDHAMDLLSNTKNIEGGFIIKPVKELSIKEGFIKIENETFTAGKMISSFLKNTEYVAIFTCTAGFEVEQLSNKFKNEGDFVQSYVIDSTGSLLVEGAMDLVYEKLKDMATINNLSITNRYSPGYCDWQVADQQKLFSFFPSTFCNVTLSESSLMSPIKSVSGIIGIGRNVKYLGYICDFCKNKECVYRAKKMYVKH
jgi:hypothetical protein